MMYFGVIVVYIIVLRLLVAEQFCSVEPLR